MTPTDWNETKRLFEEALAVPPELRAEWTAKACAGREALRRELSSLLSAHERAGAFLDTRATGPRLADVADDALLGTRLGPYRLEALLGRGGMGVVYRARRSEPELEVAIKVVRVGSDAAHVAARFRAESQILARFEHPHIGRLYDAGSTADGRPYFVMELVQGFSIDVHCGAERVDLRGRLTLFLAVCTAVSYAHGRLVVHRDIKPGNILMTAAGQPKLLDFGIARLLDEDPEQRGLETGLHLMTPEFASPEQVRGEPATVATDVHALGLLLHVLLTGRSPRRLRSIAPAELVRVVCVEETPAPSLASLHERQDDARVFEAPEAPARLARLLRGDLDSIVARALRKEPALRYRSVDQLAEDVQAYLDGRPVLARGGRWRYTLGKFVRRHRLPVALGAGLLAALLAGLATTVWQARIARAERARAERRFADVRRLATSFLFDFHDAIADLPGATHARELVVKKALEYLDGLAQEAANDAQLRLELAQAYLRVGQVQGVPGQPNLGDAPGALLSLTKALALLDRSEADTAGSREARHTRLDVVAGLARCYGRTGNFDRALDLLLDARPAAVRALGARDAGGARLALVVLVNLGEELRRRGRLGEAESLAREALAAAQTQRALWPDDAAIASALALSYRQLANVQFDASHRVDARLNAAQALALRRAAHRPDSAATSFNLADALLLTALTATDDLGRANAAYAEALALLQDLAVRDPGNEAAQVWLRSALGRWCGDLNQAGVRARPRDVCAEALRLEERANDPRNAFSQVNRGSALCNWGWQRELQGQPRQARDYYSRALAALSSAVLSASDPELQLMRAHALALRARVQLALGHPRLGAQDADAALAALGPRQEAENYYVLVTRLSARLQASRAALASGDPRAACGHAAEARSLTAHLERVLGKSERPPDVLAEIRSLEAPCASAGP